MSALNGTSPAKTMRSKFAGRAKRLKKLDYAYFEGIFPISDKTKQLMDDCNVANKKLLIELTKRYDKAVLCLIVSERGTNLKDSLKAKIAAMQKELEGL